MSRLASDTRACYSPVMIKDPHGDLPRIDYNMRQHKLGIAINWAVIFISSGVSPNVLYFALRYAAHVKLGTTLGVASAVFGVFSLLSLFKRTFLLVRANSKCRPLEGTRWQMDYFNINFIIGFIGITVTIVIGNIKKAVRVFALGLPILVTEVCFQLLVVAIMRSLHASAPMHMSTVRKGHPIRSGVYVLAEDIIAVDAGQGQKYRQQLQNRYLASRTVQSLCHEMDYFWGICGTVVGVGTMVALFVVPNRNVAFILGWAIPWAFALIMGLVTLAYCKLRLRHETRDNQWQGTRIPPEV